MVELGNISVGYAFVYNGAMFVVLPFDSIEYKYKNICIAIHEHTGYEIGEVYDFDESTLVKEVKNFYIPK